jgi:hypothetical protein
MGRSNPHYTDIADRAETRTSTITTTIIGLAFTSHAVAVAILALTQSTSTFLAWQQPVGLPFLGLGIGGLLLYGTRQQARQRAAAGAARDGQPGGEPVAGAS